MKIGLCLPTGDEVKTDFAISLWNLDRGNHNVVLLNTRTSLVPMSRWYLVKNALEYCCDAIFFIDSDLSFPEDALLRLIAHDKPIVGATYVKRRTRTILGVAYDETGIPAKSTGIHRMKWMPVGCCLIKAEVFDKVPKPWFPIEFIEELSDFMSEDYKFCSLADEVGFELWCDLDLSRELGHVSSQSLCWGTND